jgi:hypothetical protein
MTRRGFRGDWVDFAAFLLMLSGALDFFQGLIAIARGNYYTLDPNEILVVDLTAWGWILLFWGSVVALTGMGLWLRSNAARWLAVGITVLNIIAELGFTGGNHYPLWGLVVITLNVIALYALILHWHPAKAGPVAT